MASHGNLGRYAFLAILVEVSACSRSHRARPELDAVAPLPITTAPRTIDGDAALPPLRATWIERLELPDGNAAFVTVPIGATTPRPVMIAAHGAGDRPDWACSGWRGVAEGFPFVLCPEGAPTGAGTYFWRSTEQLRRVIDLALVALRARFGAYVADVPMIYAGFSAGAIYGAGLVSREAVRFPIIAMSEGGYDQLDDPHFAHAFAKSGGKRVLLGCSTGSHCVTKFRSAAKLLTSAGVDVRVNDAGQVGHNLNLEAVTSLRRDWPWLIADAPGWQLAP